MEPELDGLGLGIGELCVELLTVGKHCSGSG
jgi:hypothetical protein